jgi:hypothetical protein
VVYPTTKREDALRLLTDPDPVVEGTLSIDDFFEHLVGQLWPTFVKVHDTPGWSIAKILGFTGLDAIWEFDEDGDYLHRLAVGSADFTAFVAAARRDLGKLPSDEKALETNVNYALAKLVWFRVYVVKRWNSLEARVRV